MVLKGIPTMSQSMVMQQKQLHDAAMCQSLLSQSVSQGTPQQALEVSQVTKGLIFNCCFCFSPARWYVLLIAWCDGLL